MALIKMEFEILNVLPSRQHEGGLAYIFEKTDDLMREFNKIVKENRYIKQFMGLTLSDLRLLQGYLSGYELEEKEKYMLMDKLAYIDNQITNEIENYQEQPEEHIEPEQDVNAVQVEELKQAMVGSKDNSKYDTAYNKAVNRK
jgi:hypothetical protein